MLFSAKFKGGSGVAASAGLGCFIILFIIAINFLVGGWCVEYVTEYWLTYAGKAKDVPFWICGLIGIPFGEFAMLAAILTWFLSFVL